MRRKMRNFHLVALSLILSLASVALAQDNPAVELATTNTSIITRSVASGQKLKIRGVVVASNGDSFTVRESDGTETVVTLTTSTKIKAARKDWFRGTQ